MLIMIEPAAERPPKWFVPGEYIPYLAAESPQCSPYAVPTAIKKTSHALLVQLVCFNDISPYANVINCRFICKCDKGFRAGGSTLCNKYSAYLFEIIPVKS